MNTVFSGLSSLDDLTGGFKDGELIILGGRPGLGKTSFALKLLERTGLKQNENCFMRSFETSSSLLIRHLYALHTKLFFGLDRKENGINVFRNQHIDNGPIWIDDTPTCDLEELTDKWRYLRTEHELKLIIIDYLQLMTSSDRVTSCLMQLKSIALELSLPVIVLSQLNLTVEARADKRPIITDLLWVEGLDPVDQILFLYRDDFYKPRNEERDNKAEFILAKHPDGKNGIATVACHRTADGFLFYTGR